MTKRREWPNAAKESRDRAAEEMVAARRYLRCVLAGWFTEDRAELLRRCGIALDHVNTGLRHLESVGAETRPE